MAVASGEPISRAPGKRAAVPPEPHGDMDAMPGPPDPAPKAGHRRADARRRMPAPRPWPMFRDGRRRLGRDACPRTAASAPQRAGGDEGVVSLLLPPPIGVAAGIGRLVLGPAEHVPMRDPVRALVPVRHPDVLRAQDAF